MDVSHDLDTAERLLHDLKHVVDGELATLVTATDPAELYEPARYVLSGGGKRMRPVLLLLCAQGCGASLSEALPAAIAAEVFHNFTLVHDDIMDRAPERRGRETVHVKWDEGTAILVGDYLLSLSYRLIAKSDPATLPSLLAAYHVTVQKLCEGQTLDAAFESRLRISSDEYVRMVDLKTGALLHGCCRMGGIIAGADEKYLDLLGEIGTSLGRAFQIQDDILDLTADDDRWGKRRGGDLVQAKKTYLLTKALESEDQKVRKWFEQLVEGGGLEEEKISEARGLMEQAGIIAAAADAVRTYSDAATRGVAMLPRNEFTESLLRLIHGLRTRPH